MQTYDPRPPEPLEPEPPEPGNVLVRYSPIGSLATIHGNDRSGEPEGGGLAEYWRNLRRHKAIWLIFAFSGALAGFLVAVPQTPVYEAHASLEIVGLNDNFMNFREISPVAATGATPEASDIQTQIKILQSESLADRVVSKLRSDQRFLTETPTRLSTWRKVLHLPESSAEQAAVENLIRIAKSLKVRAAGQTRVLELTVDSTNPQLAAGFANTLAAEFIEQNLESRWKSTEKTSDWLSHQLDGMRVRLEHSEDALQAYARQSGLIFTDEKTNVSGEKLRQLQTELSAATGERIARQSRAELAQSSAPEALPDVLDDVGLRETQLKMTDLRSQIADLRAVYTPEFIKIKRLQAELAIRQFAFDRDRTAVLARIRNEYQAAARREGLLSAAYQAQAKEVSGQGERTIQYNILKREADSNRQLYDSMLQQLKQSTIAAAMRASNVRVVDAAKVPDHPYKPDVSQSAGLGLLIGVFLGAVFIVMRDRTDRTIQQPRDSVFYLGLPELGIIPSTKFDGGRSAIAESFRSTLLSILFATNDKARPKVLVLASAGSGDGKSMIVSNLAIAMAEVEQRVLVIDADMRRPRQHEIFSMSNERGLSSILREKVALNGDQSLGGLIRESEIAGLFVLTSGPETSSATSLLYGAHMRALLKYARGQFDAILIDTPPMLQIPDARVVARMADAALIVIRAGKTTRDAALAARQRFNEDGTTILGTIFNDWNPKLSPNGYYGYHDSSYRHHSPQVKSADK
ncbi:MAG TPA: polysaccharide biosynthesis tyrosine autokinase [Bryobacteraceae bacterium]|nr:polysaccharide biosynthesis tyrosine autokinase [Bryobacteraceae bacterium]